MSPQLLRSPALSRGGYTLIEIMVAMSIMALAIGAASQLSMSQSLTEEVNQKELVAVNYGENHVRLWQLAVDPALFLLVSPNSDSPETGAANSLMTATASSTSTVTGGADFATNGISVDAITVSVNWKPPGKGSTTTLQFPALRLPLDRR